MSVVEVFWIGILLFGEYIICLLSCIFMNNKIYKININHECYLE